MTSNHSQSVTIRVLAASTGVTYKIKLQLSELTVTNLRSHLAAAVPPQNQILLLGPPYKVPKNTTLQSEEILNALRLGDMEDDPIQEDVTRPRTLLTRSERSGAKRLFLFSKLDLSENAPDPPICHLEPITLTLPTEAPGPSPLSLDPSGAPPLHLPLFAFERQFMLHMSQGRVLADGADLRMAACRSCVQEQAVMARSLRAAVSNLSDHYHGAARTRAEFTANFQAKTAAHGSLLQRFDSILSNLATIPLHPSLVSIARAAGRNMENLLDTVPVERERAWATQCLHSHQRLLSLFGELEITFNQLASPSSREDIAQRDHDAENEINNLWSKVEEAVQTINEDQAQRLDMLTNAHRDAVQRITHAMNSQSDDEVQNVFTPLREMSNSTKDSVSQMRKDDEQLKELMASVADAKNRMMRRMKARLREVSVAQSSIQKVLSSVGVLREALVQQAENMIHLEHVAELPESYRVFLSELRRRRAYGQAVMASATAMMDRMAAMRDDEVRAREKFLRGAGRHLMPAFYDIFVPTLATPPPLFTPQLPALVELDTLPNVGMSSTADSAADALMQQSATVAEQGGGSTSTLTAESQHPQQSANMMTSAAVAGQEPVQQPEHLIVSADERSGDEIILDPASNTAIEAEAKTLAYENFILRQTLERLGAKPPRTYIEARAKDGAADVAGEEVVVLRKELEKTKVLLEKATHQLEASNKINDKISHSSFCIGDVGLFMPTGRGTGGKRMYLAFHTNCPHRYLSTDCIKGSPDFVLGRIIYQEELVAGEIGTDANPYGLHVGTKFWVLTVEVLKSSQ